MKEYPFTNLPLLNNSEVEGEETVQMPDGTLYKFEGNKHSRGGIKAFLEDGSRVFSQHLKLDRKTVKDITGKDRSMSPAQLSKKYDPTPYSDILLDRSSRTDDLRKNTAQLMASKHQAMQDVIFNAQEGHKDYNRKGHFKYGGEKKYQSGGDVTGLSMIVPQQMPMDIQNPWANQGNRLENAHNIMGMSIPDGRFVRSVYNPLAGHPFLTQGLNKKTGEFTGPERAIIEDFQTKLSYPQREFGLDDRSTQQFDAQYAQVLRKSMNDDPDKFLEAYIETPNGRVPVSQATDEQINTGKLIKFNKRTGMPDLVDGRQGNVGERTTNQDAFPTIETVLRHQDPVWDSVPNQLPQRGGLEYTRPLPTKTETPADVIEDKPEVTLPEDDKVRVGIDPEQMLLGIQTGMDLLGLASLRRGVPNYQYTPMQAAPVRFDPINRLSQDRGFNIAKEALDKSNLPDEVKQAQLNQLYASNIEGRTQTDLTNYQGNLGVQNQNTQNTVGAINANNQNRNAANQAYLQELSRARYMEAQQKQTYIDSMLERYRGYAENRMNLNLVNQLSRNYDFSPRSGKVNYVEGQGYNEDFGNLSAYQTPTK